MHAIHAIVQQAFFGFSNCYKSVHTIVHHVANIIWGFNSGEVNSKNNFALKLSLNKMKAKVY